MKMTLNLMIAVTLLSLHEGGAKEPYEEPYWETNNPARIFDWDTLSLLRSTKVSKVKINADSSESLIAQLQAIVANHDGAKNLRFSFKRELWEKPHADGTIGKLQVNVKLELEDDNLLMLVRYVCELNGMTFSVKTGEIVFRPLLG